MTTEVMNLATGEQKVYTLPPEKALRAAYFQERGDYNTWEYDKKEAPAIKRGRHDTLWLGDWATRANGQL